MKFSDISSSNHRAGDIILIKSDSWLSEKNVKGQKKIHGQEEAYYSHVLICVAQGIFAESTNGKVIDFFHYKDKSRSLYDIEDWRVIRHSLVAENYNKEIIQYASYQRKKPYYSLKEKLSRLARASGEESRDIDSNSMICSEFVASILWKMNEKLNQEIFPLSKDTVILPAHFQKLHEYSGWDIVDKECMVDNIS